MQARIMITEDQTMVRQALVARRHNRNHLSGAIQKLGARNRAEAVQIAQQKGWL